MTLLRLELFAALYLLIGAAYYLYHKKLIAETMEDDAVFVQRFVAFGFIVGWLPILIADIIWFIHYLFKRSSHE